MSQSTGAWLAIALALIHFGMAVWFANITPYRTAGRVLSERGAPAKDIGAPDERQHVNYVSHLLEGKGFPVFSPQDPDLYEDYQSHQPPAYYVLAAGWCRLLAAQDLDGKDDGIKLRYLSAVLGAFDVVAVFALGAWGFKRPEIGVAAAAFAALLPMNVALSGAVSNDVLLYLLCTVTLAISARGLQDGWTTERCLVAGICIGLALLTKTTAVSLLPAVLFAAVAAGSGKPKPLGWFLAILPILLFVVPWWVRNQELYGDPLAMHAFRQAFPGSAQAQPLIEAVGLPTYLLSWVGWWTIRSFFGAFGYMDIWLNETGFPTGAAPNALYRVLSAVSVLILIGWLLSWGRYKEGRSNTVQVMNLIFIVVVVALFISFNLQYFQAQARYVLPAIGPIACIFGLGTLSLFKGRMWPAVLALLIVFGGSAVYAGVRLPGEFEKRVSG